MGDIKQERGWQFLQRAGGPWHGIHRASPSGYQETGATPRRSPAGFAPAGPPADQRQGKDLQRGVQLPQGPLQAFQALAPAELRLAHRVFGNLVSLIQIQPNDFACLRRLASGEGKRGNSSTVARHPTSCGVTATSHERDFYGWVEQQCAALRDHDSSRLDSAPAQPACRLSLDPRAGPGFSCAVRHPRRLGRIESLRGTRTRLGGAHPAHCTASP
jgi:hypothetical protein